MQYEFMNDNISPLQSHVKNIVIIQNKYFHTNILKSNKYKI